MTKIMSSFRLSEAAYAHRQRCKSLPAMRPGEADRLVTAFLSDNEVIICPKRYAVAAEQHEGSQQS